MQNFTLPLGFGNLDFQDWIRGLVAAFIGGGASAFVSGIVNMVNHPGESIWRSEFWGSVTSVFVLAGLVNMMMFLRTKPMPDMKQVEKTIQITTPAPGAPPKVVETVKETHEEPVKPEALDKDK